MVSTSSGPWQQNQALADADGVGPVQPVVVLRAFRRKLAITPGSSGRRGGLALFGARVVVQPGGHVTVLVGEAQVGGPASGVSASRNSAMAGLGSR